ncbi:oocyte-expressed protein homolog [Elephas maximus indicus]|uniref:oocyte-expressed protein homolog n=1 Tax=Elephas maximus indicus TaxID=99487 RepID=UPI002116A44A|nr:oocyte-expressed protein homolog [Elephas maximus indicus]
MVDNAGGAEAQVEPDSLVLPHQGPTLRLRPWWFPVEELKEPLVFYLDAWLVDLIFGPDRAIIPKIEWMSQILLTVDVVDSSDLAKITIFGRPRVQNRVKKVLLAVASWHRKRRHRSEKMEQLEEFLKAGASSPQAPQHPIA